MRCSVCGGNIGGRGDRCPNNGEKWHNQVHKRRHQRKKWGGPLQYWDNFWSRDYMPVVLSQLFQEGKYRWEKRDGILVFTEIPEEDREVWCSTCQCWWDNRKQFENHACMPPKEGSRYFDSYPHEVKRAAKCICGMIIPKETLAVMAVFESSRGFWNLHKITCSYECAVRASLLEQMKK